MSWSTCALLGGCCHEAIRGGERAGARECAARARMHASAAQAHGVRRGGVATSRRPSEQLCNRYCSNKHTHQVATLAASAQPSSAYVCILAGIQWDKAMPFEGRAEGGWPLTVTPRPLVRAEEDTCLAGVSTAV